MEFQQSLSWKNQKKVSKTVIILIVNQISYHLLADD